MMTVRVKNILKFLVALLLGLGLVVFFLLKVDRAQLWEALKSVDPLYLALASLASLAIVALNSIQLKLFLPRFDQISFKRMFSIVALFSMTVNVVPFWGGHALFVYLVAQREKLGSEVALSVMTLDQIIEGFAKLFIFGVAAFSFTLPLSMQRAIQVFLGVVVLAYTLLFVISYRWSRHPEVSHDLHTKFLHRLKGRLVLWAKHLQVLRSWRGMLTTVGLAMFMKFLEVLAVYSIQRGLNLELSLSSAFLIVAVLSMATMLPLTPGRVGIFEGAVLFICQFLGVEQSRALALGVLIHMAHTLPFIVAGYWAGVKMGFKRGESKALQL